ncbi:MAG: hypothetical protein K0R22_50 [Sporomusa sp.]|jgi:Zn-dependent peptidase ImmA (M78 family)|nr:hypothetical protein [Sporomusa sp.]
MENMLNLAHSEKIIVEKFHLEPPLKGIYICQTERPPIIGLSSLIKHLSEERSIMAEELGHHFTSVGDCLPKQFFNYAHRLTIDKSEYKALRWAANYLIPDEDLLEVLHDGLYRPGEIAEHFCVNLQIATLRIELFKNSAYKNFLPLRSNIRSIKGGEL